MKGSSAEQEVEEARGALRKRGLVAEVLTERAYPDAKDRAQYVRDVLRALGQPLGA